MLYGEELLKSIQKRCRIQPGMLVKSNHDVLGDLLALVVEVAPGCTFDRDYEGADEHIFYRLQAFDGTPVFVDYVCNMEQVS